MMQPPYNDRWERRKRYLFRNLLPNPGYCLSPIPEETRSESSDDRPYSPLPDLIIEPEPKRHDESEEFYQGLERRIKKYYKLIFIDGVDCEDYQALIDDEDSSEFEVHRSMASTFLIEANNHEGMQRQDIMATEIIHNPENVNISDDETEGDSKSIESRLSESSNGERIETDLNVSRNITELNEEVSKTIDTESDSTQTHHRVLTTIAQIHEEVKRTKPITRVFESGSPVLMPTFYKFSRTVFGNVSDIINAVRSEESNVVDDKEQDTIEEIEFDKIAKKSSQNESKESSQLKTNIADPDLEVEVILEGTIKTVSNATEDSREVFDDKVTNDSENEESHETDDLLLINSNNDNEEIIDVDDDSVTTSEGEEEQLNKEDSIGFDEFNSNGLGTKDKSSDEEEIIETNKDSFEMPIRREIFESKNKRRTSVLSTDEENDKNQGDSEEFEPIEVMRSTKQAESHEALRRYSSMSQEDPVITATKATAENIEEDISEDDDEINASADEEMRHAQAELHESLLRESTAFQNGVITVTGSQNAENLAFSDDFIDTNVSVQKEMEKVSSKAKEEATSISKVIKSAAEVCNDTWTVSPVENNFEKLNNDIPISRNHESKKREKKRGPDVAIDEPICKKKKHKNIETQTSAMKKPNITWDSLKTDFFVGSPLIFKLCGCRDHVCP